MNEKDGSGASDTLKTGPVIIDAGVRESLQILIRLGEMQERMKEEAEKNQGQNTNAEIAEQLTPTETKSDES